MQKRDRDIMNRHAGGCLTIALAIMSVSMKDEVGAMAVNDLCQARRSEKRIDFRRFAVDSCGDGRIVKDDDAFVGPELRHGTLKL